MLKTFWKHGECLCYPSVVHANRDDSIWSSGSAQWGETFHFKTKVISHWLISSSYRCLSLPVCVCACVCMCVQAQTHRECFSPATTVFVSTFPRKPLVDQDHSCCVSRKIDTRQNKLCFHFVSVLMRYISGDEPVDSCMPRQKVCSLGSQQSLEHSISLVSPF